MQAQPQTHISRSRDGAINPQENYTVSGWIREILLLLTALEIYASLSTDGGATWVPNQKISTAKMIINCTSCNGGPPPIYYGDYSGCSSNGNIADLAWTDFRAGNFGSYFGYFPDYAMKVNPSVVGMGSLADSSFIMVSIPSVKLYSYTVKFSAVVTPPPTTGTIAMTFLNRSTNVPLDLLSLIS